MTQVKIRQDIRIGNESVTVEKTQRGGLNRSTQIKWAALEDVRQVGNEHLPGVVPRRTVKHQAEGAFGIMLTDEYDRSLEKGSAQLAAIEQQLAL
jgi:hypothetical protein